VHQQNTEDFMEFFRIKKAIPFMRHAVIFNVISSLTFVAAVFFLFTNGLHLSVEFKGGTVMEVQYPNAANLQKIRGTLEELGYAQPEVTGFGTARDVLIRLPVTGTDSGNGSNSSQLVFDALCKAEQGSATQIDNLTEQGEHIVKGGCVAASGSQALVLQKVEFVGPQVGEELVQNGMNALAMTIIGIMIYLAIRFEWKFAVATVIANLHDVVIILGFFAYFQWEFSLTVLAAVLAVLGYSVNESVVIFDRIRENFRKQRKSTVQEVIDSAITSTISRTIITHGSTQMMVLSMLFFGGPTLHYFAVALTIGICFGIYSSVFVAASIAMWLGVKREDLLKPIKEKDDTDGAVV
jgi:preprotein translocase subunit SecF